jgi:hypothetical protein
MANSDTISPWPEAEVALRDAGLVPVCEADGSWHFLAADIAAARCGRVAPPDGFHAIANAHQNAHDL